jgi:WD40 repeat protein
MTPDHHQKTRPFGITSIATNTNSSRIYALSRDSTIYAYSTQHLVLGSVPEMLPSNATTAPNRYSTENQTGLGPIFGIRHPSLIASSFYVKAALRPASPDQPELIATGSADGNVFVFSTDERDIRLRGTRISPSTTGVALAGPPTTTTTTTTTMTTTKTTDMIAMDQFSATPLVNVDTRSATPVYWWGTRLAHGHSYRNEVSHVAWTRDGDLVSCGDDLRTRIWREDSGTAARFRREGFALGATTNKIGFAIVDKGDEEDETDGYQFDERPAIDSDEDTDVE